MASSASGSDIQEKEQQEDKQDDSLAQSTANVLEQEGNEDGVTKDPTVTEVNAGKLSKGPEEASATETEPFSVPDSCLDQLSEGLLQALLPHFLQHEESLTELTRNQVLLIETLQQENRKFSENKMVEDLTKMMIEAKKYQGKLTSIKKEMTSLHEKSTKLKKRALKLQQQKMKENLEKEQQREREIEEDRKLTAKRPAASTSTTTKTAPHR